MTMAILPRYVIRLVFFAMLGSVVGLWALQMVFAYLSELERLTDSHTLTNAVWYVFYRSPYFLVKFIPTGVLLGAVVGLGLLANNSELVVMQAGGISVYRIIGWAMVPAFLFVLASLAINQFILPISNQKASVVVGQGRDDGLVSLQGHWLVKKTASGMDIVYVSYADSAGNLGQTKQYGFDDKANLTNALRAGGGNYQGKTSGEYLWQLTDISRLNIGALGVVRQEKHHEVLALPLAPTQVHLFTKDAEDLSLTDLYAHQQLMSHQGNRSLRHELAFWQKLFSPFAVLSLVLVASSFVFGSLRSGGLGLRIVMALLTGLLFGYLTDLLGFVALASQFSPLVMALLPVIIGAGVGLWLLKRQGL